MRAGQDIVLTKWIGLSGTQEILFRKEEELSKRFAPFFIRQIKELKRELEKQGEADVAEEAGAAFIQEVGEGGIFAALWRLAKEADLGIVADLKKMSVRQETIEVCEYFGLNPYQLLSENCYLIVADDGQKVVDKLAECEIHGTVIGKLTDNNDKIIRNGGEVRFIDRPAPDEMKKVYYGKLNIRD